LPCYKTAEQIVCLSLGNFAFTPGDKWEIEDVCSDFNIVFHVYLNTITKKIEKCSYSLMHVRQDERGLSQTIPAYDLLEKMDKESKRRFFLLCRNAVKRFTKKKVHSLLPENELFL
jgi:hypothetical protein